MLSKLENAFLTRHLCLFKVTNIILLKRLTLTALSLTIPCVLDKPEVLARVTEQPRFPPWEFDKDHNKSLKQNDNLQFFFFF